MPNVQDYHRFDIMLQAPQAQLCALPKKLTKRFFVRRSCGATITTLQLNGCKDAHGDVLQVQSEGEVDALQRTAKTITPGHIAKSAKGKNLPESRSTFAAIPTTQSSCGGLRGAPINY